MDKREFLRCGGNRALVDERTINNLPSRMSNYYTPNRQLDFDEDVRDYCADGKNHISLATCGRAPTASGKAANSYTTDRAPFSRVSRSSKVILSGDVAVGKTSLVNRFGRGADWNGSQIGAEHQTTIGVDFDIQRFQILNQPFSLQIWDTAGLERFKCITSSYYRGCQAALLVFDMSNMSSLANVLRWREEVLEAACPPASQTATLEPTRPPLLFLVGTKSDLAINRVHREFTVEQANKIASIIGAELWLVSARSGENVDELFRRLAGLTFERLIKAEICLGLLKAQKLTASLRERILEHRHSLALLAGDDLANPSNRLIKITRKKRGDDRRSRCVNVQFMLRPRNGQSRQ